MTGVTDQRRPQQPNYPIPQAPVEPIPSQQYNLSPLYNQADWQIDPNNYLDTFMREYRNLFDNFQMPDFKGYDVGQAGLGQWSPGQAGLGQFWSPLLGMTSDEIMQNLQNPKYSQQMGVIRDWTTGAANAQRDQLMDSFAAQGGRTAPQAEMLQYQGNQAAQQQAPLMKQGALDVWQNAVGNAMGQNQLESGIYSDAKMRELQNAALAGDAYADAKLRELKNAQLGMEGYFGAMPYQSSLYNALLSGQLGAFGTMSDFLQKAGSTDMQAQQQSFNNLMGLAGVRQGADDINQKNYMNDLYAKQNYQTQLQQYQDTWSPRTQQNPQQNNSVSDWLSR